MELQLQFYFSKTSPSPLNKRRERRMNWKKEPPKSEFLAAQMVFEPLSDGDGEHTESTKRQNVTGFEEEQIQVRLCRYQSHYLSATN